jgi:hypothetical protein
LQRQHEINNFVIVGENLEQKNESFVFTLKDSDVTTGGRLFHVHAAAT